METISETVLSKKQAGVLKEEIIQISYKIKKVTETLKLRRVCYQDEKGPQICIYLQQHDYYSGGNSTDLQKKMGN
ncbi:MAG: hypothetical protein WKG06_11690 [Segetibacter sp.]